MADDMTKIEVLFKEASKKYNNQTPHLETCRELATASVEKLRANAAYKSYSVHRAHNIETRYAVFRKGSQISRPIAEALFTAAPPDFKKLDALAIETLSKKKPLDAAGQEAVTRYIYTTVMSFAATYDLWKPGSRKTPGTFFEILMAGLMGLHMPNYALSKHVNLGAMLGEDTSGEEEVAREETGTDEEEEESSVSTDLVIKSDKKEKWAVLPLKITTRERVVQPFAHQRILQSSFKDQYYSFLCCISETQLDKKTATVKQICVPGTIKLFQKFLSPIEGLYYCDIPARYSLPSLTRYVPVKTLGVVFNDIRVLLG
jgi:hypothetical protein